MAYETQLKELYPRAAPAHLDAFAAQADAVFGRFEIDRNPVRLHFLLAQIGHESGGLTVTEENLNYRAERIAAVWPSRFADAEAAQPYARNPEALANSVYANRMGNGDPASGDGWRFRGRGYIQITGRDGYVQVGRVAGLDLVADPERAHAPETALLVACAFWDWKKLNALCDGLDLEPVTRRINGGLIGMDDRRAWLDKVRRVFGAPPAPEAEQPDAALVLAIQRALRARGYGEIGAPDGLVGPRTLAAAERFRLDHGLPPGPIDLALAKALGVEP